MRSFGDRLVLGGDDFYLAPGARMPFEQPANDLDRIRSFLDQLPTDIARKLAVDNATRIYRLR